MIDVVIEWMLWRIYDLETWWLTLRYGRRR